MSNTLPLLLGRLLHRNRVSYGLLCSNTRLMYSDLTTRQRCNFCYYLSTLQPRLGSITLIGLLPLKLYLPCNLSLHSTFMTVLTLATNSLNEGGFPKVSTCGLIATNSNCSLTDPPKCKRMTQSIYIFTATKESMNYCITIENFKQTQELMHITTSIT
jgi:hypothetical protein